MSELSKDIKPTWQKLKKTYFLLLNPSKQNIIYFKNLFIYLIDFIAAFIFVSNLQFARCICKLYQKTLILLVSLLLCFCIEFTVCMLS